MYPSERARLADEALRNPVVTEAFEVIERNLVAEWKSSNPEKWKDRERTYERLQALIDLRAQLQTFIDTAALDSTANR